MNNRKRQNTRSIRRRDTAPYSSSFLIFFSLLYNRLNDDPSEQRCTLSFSRSHNYVLLCHAHTRLTRRKNATDATDRHFFPRSSLSLIPHKNVEYEKIEMDNTEHRETVHRHRHLRLHHRRHRRRRRRLGFYSIHTFSFFFSPFLVKGTERERCTVSIQINAAVR